MVTPRARFAIAAVAVVASVGGLIAFALMGTTTYYRTPAELLQDPGDPGERVRVAGRVVSGTIERDGPTTTFTISDGSEELAITTDYQLPDIFDADIEVVAEGAMGPSGVFSAGSVLAKCPSKFKEKLQKV